MGSNKRPDWGQEESDLLTQMWTSQKSSASKIAAALEERFGRPFSRNAVIGRAHRLGLQGQGAPSGGFWTAKEKKPKAPKEKTVKAAAAALIARPPPAAFDMADGNFMAIGAEPVTIPVSDRIGVMELRGGMCRWPIGDPLTDDFTFCGEACDIARSYCAGHREIAYRPIERAKKVAWRAFR